MRLNIELHFDLYIQLNLLSLKYQFKKDFVILHNTYDYMITQIT